MKKRKKLFASLLVFIVTLQFFVPHTAKAFSATITLAATANKVGLPFDFELQNISSGNTFTLTAFSTLDGSLRLFGQIPFGDYNLTPIIPQGWKLNNINCSTPPFSQGGYSLVGNGSNVVQLSMPNFLSNVLCSYDYTETLSKTPVLIVPGVLGTNIYKGDSLLWANNKMATGFDGFMDPLGFNPNLTPLDSSLQALDVIRKMTINTGIVNFKIYDYTDGLINQLTSPGIGYTEGKDLFTFPYDWRFGVTGKDQNGSTTVDQLRGQIDYISRTTGISVVDIVAHSTGGLIVKKYVMDHPADHHIGKAVFVGVPNLGAPKSLKVLTMGDDFDVFGLDPAEMKKIGKNMPIIYDLAPSEEYYNLTGSLFHIHNPLAQPSEQDKDLNFTDMWQRLIVDSYANAQGLASSTEIHSPKFENYDLRNENIDLYSIVGCKIGTFDKFSEWVNKDSTPTFDFSRVATGDATVPFMSADSLAVDANKTFFAQGIKHGSLLSANGSRQLIVNILTGSTLNTGPNLFSHDEVQQNPKLCEIKGEQIKIKSPVDVSVTDQNGNFSGLAGDGSIQNDIPGADYEVWGEHKYVFLPTDGGQIYNISLKGSGSGTFTLIDESIDGNTTTQTQVFSNLPVTTALSGQVNLGAAGTTLSLDNNGDGTTDQIIQPSSVLNSERSQDLIFPVSTSTLTGLMGQAGFYRSNVNVSLLATDPIIPGQESQTSGILKTQYSLDGGVYQACAPSPQPSPIGGGSGCSITVNSEGQHIISFFSTDRAGNNEPEQIISFTIDKTAPEFLIQFNSLSQDLDFTPTDASPTALSSSTVTTLIKKGFKGFPKQPVVKVIDSDSSITATDAAGNVSQIQLKDRNRKKSMKAEVASLSYNGQVQNTVKTVLKFNWNYDKSNTLKTLEQHIKSKKDFNIDAVYGDGKTKLTGKDQSGKISKTLSGLVQLKITTNKGDLNWGY